MIHHPLRRTPKALVPAVLGLGLALLLLTGLRPAVLEAHSLEVSGGFQSSFDTEHRAIFGTTGAIGVGYAAPLWPGRSWLMLEAGYLWASGQSLYYDPTFDRPDAEYWAVPILLGVRANVVPERIQGPVALYLGAGAITAFTGFKDHEGKTYHAPTWGAMFELRPEVALSETLFLWARQRFSLLADVDYNYGAGNINYSGSQFQMGLRIRLR